MKRLLLAILALSLLVSYGCSQESTTQFSKVYVSRVRRVVDGDTLVLINGERVRLIGIDTPEIHESKKLYRDAGRSKRDIETIIALGRKSYQFTKNLVEWKTVKLEFDLEKRDKYGRLLAYVYDIGTYRGKTNVILPPGYEIVNANEIFVNATILKSGYASLMTIPPNIKYVGLFTKLYREARENNRGLWKE